MSEKQTNTTNIDQVQLNCSCVDESTINGRQESILISFSFSAPSGYKAFKEPPTILSRKGKKDHFRYIKFYLQDDDNNIVDFNGEI